MKSNYSISLKKGVYHFCFSGDLEEALSKAKRDLEKERENKEVENWRWIKKKAERVINAHSEKIYKLTCFIEVAEKQIAQDKADEKSAATE